METSRLLQLAATISKSTGVIQATLAKRDLPEPSFDVSSPWALPPDLMLEQATVLDAASELIDLLLNPLDLMYNYGAHNNHVCLQAITRFNIASCIKPDERVSYAQIAESTGQSESVIKRLLRHAITMRIFCEPEKDMVAHTAASKSLIDPVIHQRMMSASEDLWPATVRIVDALEKFPRSEEPTDTGFALANGSRERHWEIIRNDPERAERFSDVMKSFDSAPPFDVAHIVECYDWKGLGEGLVVDMGGSSGHVAFALARKYPALRVIVQDLPEVIAGETPKTPEDVADRVEYQSHDFFTEQPVVADVYFFRWIFHNWSDKYAKKILQSLIPALKDGARIVIQDGIMPKPGETSLWHERMMRSIDLTMLAYFNSSERTLDDWRSCFIDADRRFELCGVTQPPGSALSIIELQWNANLQKGEN